MGDTNPRRYFLTIFLFIGLIITPISVRAQDSNSENSSLFGDFTRVYEERGNDSSSFATAIGIMEEDGLKTRVTEDLRWNDDGYTWFAEEAFPGQTGQKHTGKFMTSIGVVELEYEMINGVAVYQGDMLLDLSSEIKPVKKTPSTDEIKKKNFKLAAIKDWSYLWPKRVVPYDYDPNLGTWVDVGMSDMKSRIQSAMNHWAKAGFIFRKKKSTDKHYVYFTNSSSWFAGSAYVGMQKAARTYVNLGKRLGVGTIIHEIGHALGLFHEQTRKDRNDHVIIYWDNITDGKKTNYCRYGSNDKNIPHCTYKKVDHSRDGVDLGSYDFNSIMHYGSFTFGKPSASKIIGCALFLPTCDMTFRKPTMKKKKDNSLIYANRKAPSQQDIMYVKELYKNTDYCAGILDSNGNTKLGNSGSFNKQLNGCNELSYSFKTTDYVDLNLLVESKNKIDLPENQFVVGLKSPDIYGSPGFDYAQNPGNNKKQLILKRKMILPTVQPWDQALELKSYLYDDVDLKITYSFTPSQVPLDEFDKKGKGSKLSDPADLGEVPYSMLVSKMVRDLSIHNTQDTDFFKVTLPKPPEYALEDICNPVIKKNGRSKKADLIPGTLTFEVMRQDGDNNRMLRVVVYKNGDPNKLRPWGWGRKAKEIKCPYDQFPNGEIIFSVEDCSGNIIPGSNPPNWQRLDQNEQCIKTKRHLYEIAVTLRPTMEDLPPIEAPKLDYDVDYFKRKEWGKLGMRGMEQLIQQGPGLVGILGDELITNQGPGGMFDLESYEEVMMERGRWLENDLLEQSPILKNSLDFEGSVSKDEFLDHPLQEGEFQEEPLGAALQEEELFF